MNRIYSRIFRFFAIPLVVAMAGCEQVAYTPVSIGDSVIKVTLATTPAERAEGLMGREILAPDEGMLFIFPDERIQRFWMLNVPIALDIGFFNSEGRLVNHLTMPPDHGEKTYASTAPAKYVVEMPAGWYVTHGMRQGASLKLPESIKRLRVY